MRRICPVCNGTGFDPRPSNTTATNLSCRCCDGLGWYEDSDTPSPPKIEFGPNKYCPFCGKELNHA